MNTNLMKNPGIPGGPNQNPFNYSKRVSDIADLFQQTECFTEHLVRLEEHITLLEQKIELIESSENWKVLSIAAKKLGISPSALRQKIKRDNIPEHEAWRQKGYKARIYVNMAVIGRYL